MLLLVHQLGNDHIVWDEAAEIGFVKAVSEPVFATFAVGVDKVDEVRRATLAQFKAEPVIATEIVTREREVVARVRTTLYARREDARQRFARATWPVG